VGRRRYVAKSRLNLKLESELKDWVQEYAKRNGTSISQMIREYFRLLKLKEESQDEEHVSQI
jgi:hypothetical protein